MGQPVHIVRFRHLMLSLAALFIQATMLPALLLAETSASDQPLKGDDLTKAAISILKENCYQCHGVDFKAPGLDILHHDSLMADRGEDRDPYITPKNLEESLVWRYISTDYMPPKGPLSDDDKSIVKKWIEKGAPWVEANRKPRGFITETDILDAIYQDLVDHDDTDRRFQRYFTITHLYNNPAITDAELRLYRAALSKAVNSLSDQHQIALPEAIDDAKTIYNVDLRDYGWDDLKVWQKVLAAYPYGLKPLSEVSLDVDEDRADALKMHKDIERIYGAAFFDGIAYLRADWFAVTATRPPLYHALAKIPHTKKELLKQLGVNYESNLRRSRARRAGMVKSGVSGQNRLLEYHPSDFGAYWESYDFLPNSSRSNLMRFPLGPKESIEKKFHSFAFEQAGGEIIFNLPNRLQGYMLTDEKGNRIDEGPVQIVWDSSYTSGSPVIVNGISCMSCHKDGMKDIKDDVRSGIAIGSTSAREKIGDLYASRKEMDELIKDSRREYLSRLEKTIGPFLRWGEDKNAPITRFPEPISTIARLHYKDLDRAKAASELGYASPEDMPISTGMKRLGLGSLASEGTVKRAFWEATDAGFSLFQEAARELEIASPQQAN